MENKRKNTIDITWALDYLRNIRRRHLTNYRHYKKTAEKALNKADTTTYITYTHFADSELELYLEAKQVIQIINNERYLQALS